METTASVRFFDAQFERQLAAGELQLNPFEQAALPFLHGHVLDCGCGLGNLALAAARRGCTVEALDGSAAAIAHLQALATAHRLPITTACADLREHVPPREAFDAVVSIGLLMFFACPDARRQLARLRDAVRPGGVVVVNVLIEGTTYLDMFDADAHCLFGCNELRQAFDGWTLLHDSEQCFEAPRGLVKRFSTLIARKPQPGS
jgi:tellurite methyltransferase